MNRWSCHTWSESFFAKQLMEMQGDKDHRLAVLPASVALCSLMTTSCARHVFVEPGGEGAAEDWQRNVWQQPL